jgi:hypothetical protein
MSTEELVDTLAALKQEDARLQSQLKGIQRATAIRWRAWPQHSLPNRRRTCAMNAWVLLNLAANGRALLEVT